jgi:hypothetical protein
MSDVPIRIGGKPFRCPCGRNAFAKVGDNLYACDACGEVFSGAAPVAVSPDIVGRRLPESRTHKSRSYDLVLGSHELSDYILTIRQGEPHRRNFECVTYAVQVVAPPATAPRDRVFCLAKDDNDSEVYEVVLRRVGVAWCTCEAGRRRLLCKHLEALTDAVYVCGLPGVNHEPSPLPPPQADPVPF